MPGNLIPSEQLKSEMILYSLLRFSRKSQRSAAIDESSRPWAVVSFATDNDHRTDRPGTTQRNHNLPFMSKLAAAYNDVIERTRAR